MVRRLPHARGAPVGLHPRLRPGRPGALPEGREIDRRDAVLCGLGGRGVRIGIQPAPRWPLPVTRAVFDQGSTEAHKRIDSEGCHARPLAPLMENAARLLSGRRPATGVAAKRGNLVAESAAPLSTKHLMSLEGMQSSGMATWESHVREFSARGFRVLECSYDREPTDRHWEVQDHWTGPGVQLLQGVSALPSLISAAQSTLQRANGAAKVRTCSGTTGRRAPNARQRWIRWPAKEIFAPRNTTVPEVTDVREPTVTRKLGLADHLRLRDGTGTLRSTNTGVDDSRRCRVHGKGPRWFSRQTNSSRSTASSLNSRAGSGSTGREPIQPTRE